MNHLLKSLLPTPMTWLALFAVVALSACSNESSDQNIEDARYDISELGAKPVAKIDNAQISRAQLDHALAFYSTNPMVNAEEGRIKVLNDMIEEQVMYNKAMANDFDKSPEFINNQRKLLAYEYKKFLQKKVAQSTKITDLDLELYYQENIKKYTKPSMQRMAIFLQRNDLPAGKLSLKQISEAASYLKPEQGFGKYALESHHSKTANRAGKLPWVGSESQIAGVPSELFEEADELKIGEVSKPIKTERGTFLVRLMAKKEKTVTDLAELKSSLRQQLLIQRKHDLLNTFVGQAKAQSKIEIFKENLGKSGAVNTSSDSFGPPGFPVSTTKDSKQ